MFAVIETGGKQYKVAPGQKFKFEKLETKEGDSLVFDKVLLVADADNVKIGAPYVSGSQVEGKVLRQGHNKTVIVFKYSSKARYRKKKGHRQRFTEVEITGIK